MRSNCRLSQNFTVAFFKIDGNQMVDITTILTRKNSENIIPHSVTNICCIFFISKKFPKFIKAFLLSRLAGAMII